MIKIFLSLILLVSIVANATSWMPFNSIPDSNWNLFNSKPNFSAFDNHSSWRSFISHSNFEPMSVNSDWGFYYYMGYTNGYTRNNANTYYKSQFENYGKARGKGYYENYGKKGFGLHP